MADHYLYTASIGLIALFAGGVAAWSLRRDWPPLLTGTFQALLLTGPALSYLPALQRLPERGDALA